MQDVPKVTAVEARLRQIEVNAKPVGGVISIPQETFQWLLGGMRAHNKVLRALALRVVSYESPAGCSSIESVPKDLTGALMKLTKAPDPPLTKRGKA